MYPFPYPYSVYAMQYGFRPHGSLSPSPGWTPVSPTPGPLPPGAPPGAPWSGSPAPGFGPADGAADQPAFSSGFMPGHFPYRSKFPLGASFGPFHGQPGFGPMPGYRPDAPGFPVHHEAPSDGADGSEGGLTEPGQSGEWRAIPATEQAEDPAAGRGECEETKETWQLRDYGPEPFVTDIEEATKRNRNFRTALWTGNHLQLTLMSIPEGESIGLERHEHVDQFIRIEEGRGLVRMGPSPDRLDFQRAVEEDDVILIPAGIWHNVINTGPRPLKLYSIYAPPNHPRGTVHVTKRDAEAAEG